MLRQSLVVRDVDLSADVSQLRRTWEASSLIPATAFTTGSRKRPSSGREGSRHQTGSPGGRRRAEAGNSGTPSEQDFRLVFAGKDLLPGKPLREYGLGRDSTIHLLERLKGGAQLGKVVKGRSQVGGRASFQQYLLCT